MGRKKIKQSSWFTVSFTNTRAQARKEKKRLSRGKGDPWGYKIARNPDKKGWTLFGRRK